MIEYINNDKTNIETVTLKHQLQLNKRTSSVCTERETIRQRVTFVCMYIKEG